jgi:hypothetical protein
VLNPSGPDLLILAATDQFLLLASVTCAVWRGDITRIVQCFLAEPGKRSG